MWKCFQNLKSSWFFLGKNITETIKKCIPPLDLLMRIKQYLSLDVRKLFYNAYILPHIEYCSLVWGSAPDYRLNKILKLQKRAARIILDADYTTPSATLFDTFEWMPIQDRIRFHKATMIYKSLNNLTPSYLNESLIPCSAVHNRSLRAVTIVTTCILSI